MSEKRTVKNWPTNSHMDYYSPDIGWSYLGSDNKHDYYINHVERWTSIVYGEEPWKYVSMPYDQIVSGSTDRAGSASLFAILADEYPYSKLINLVNKSVEIVNYE